MEVPLIFLFVGGAGYPRREAKIFVVDSYPDLNSAVDFLHVVAREGFGGWSLEHGAGRHVVAGAVTLAHRCGAGEQAGRERARVRCARAQFVEGIEAVAYSGHPDPLLEVFEVVRVHCALVEVSSVANGRRDSGLSGTLCK